MTQHDSGKGDKQITPTDKEQFDKNWDMVFGGDKFKVKEFKEEVEMAIKELEEQRKNGTV